MLCTCVFRRSLEKDILAVSNCKHPTALCKQNCEKNGTHFGHEPFKCNWNNETMFRLLNRRSILPEKRYEKIWVKRNKAFINVADYDFKCECLQEVQRDVSFGRRSKRDQVELQQKVDEITKRNELHDAARNGRWDIVSQLIPKLVNKNPKDEDGLTPLHLACQNGHIDVVRHYEEFSEDMNPKAEGRWQGRLPLHFAAENGHFEIVQHLVQFLGDDINPCQTNGMSVLHLAAKQGHLQIVSYFTEKLEDMNPAQKSDDEFNGKTPLHYAAQEGHIKAVQHICERLHGEKNPPSSNGETPLHLAAKYGHMGIVTFYDHSLSIVNPVRNSLCFNGRTPLHNAAQMGHFQVVVYICDQLEDKNPKDQYGYTPLHLAAEHGHIDIVRFISRCVKDKHPITETNLTPANLANEAGHFQIVNLLCNDAIDFTTQVDETDSSLKLKEDSTIRMRFSKMMARPNSKKPEPTDRNSYTGLQQLFFEASL